MKTEEEIMEHIKYLTSSIDPDDAKQIRDLNIQLSELSWVLETEGQQ